MLSTILIVIAVIIVVFLIVASRQPADFCIRRSLAVQAPASVVFPFVNDVHKFQEWSPWAKMDPTSKVTYDGPPSGVGASFHWAGGKSGEGTMTNTESRADEVAVYQLEFVKPFTTTNIAEFTLKPEGNQTVVTWSMRGVNAFMFKAMSLILNTDKMVGRDFEKGLASLKALAEAK